MYSVVPVDRVELSVAQWSWPFATDRRQEIDAYFATQQRENPALWDGRLLLLRDYEFADRTFHGTMFETRYSVLLAGLEFSAFTGNLKACFGVAALMSYDGAFIAGSMASYTRNAGRILFPSGSLDPSDIDGSTVDVHRSILRELEEETGLRDDEVEPAPEWYPVLAGPRIPICKVIRVPERAEALRNRILANLASQHRPEFTDICLVRDLGDVDPRMPPWMQAFFSFFWQ
jgi:8-oxo-dGTP pyrophosphatase MutT (NUDIX family)